MGEITKHEYLSSLMMCIDDYSKEVHDLDNMLAEELKNLAKNADKLDFDFDLYQLEAINKERQYARDKWFKAKQDLHLLNLK